MSEKEKQRLQQIRNNVHSRRSREKRKDNEREMQDLFESNEAEINRLEKMADKMIKELGSDYETKNP